MNVSDRIYAGYTDTEIEWIEEVHAFPTFPADGYIDEGFIMPTVPAGDRTLKAQSANLGTEYVKMRAYAWSDAPMPTGKTIASMHASLWENIQTKYTDYIKFINDEYAKAVSYLKK